MPVVLGISGSLNLSLGSGDLPHVRIVVNGALLSAGSLYEITGSVASGYSWTVRGGSGAATGEQVILVDTLAPLNDPITYTALLDGAVVSTGVITRTYLGKGGDGFARDVIATLNSSSFAGVFRLRGDARAGERRFHASTVRGSRYQPMRLDPVAGAGGGSLSVLTVGAHTDALGALLDANSLSVIYHPKCRLPGCSIPPVQVVYFTSESSDLTQRLDVGERTWSLSYIDQSDPESGFVESLQDWDDFDAAGLTWDDIDALSLTWDQWDRVVWDESG